jgi:hypothetical protein
MSKSFSVHEFFIQQGVSYCLEISPHKYTLDIEKGQDEEIENARLVLSTLEDSDFSVEISVPKDALRQIVNAALKYLETGEEASFRSKYPRGKPRGILQRVS